VGVGIIDFSTEIEPPNIEVNIFGVPYPLYQEVFPQQVVSYKRQFS